MWVDSWQQQCCGEPFEVGSQVAWMLRAIDREFARSVLGDDLAQSVTHAEEHHGELPEDGPAVVGRVTAIHTVHCEFAPRIGRQDNTRYPVPGTTVLSSAMSADGWEPEPDGLVFVSYLVEVADS